MTTIFWLISVYSQFLPSTLYFVFPLIAFIFALTATVWAGMPWVSVSVSSSSVIVFICSKPFYLVSVRLPVGLHPFINPSSLCTPLPSILL